MATPMTNTTLQGHRPGQEGQLDLRLAVIGGATRAIRSLVRAPFQLSRARYDPSDHAGTVSFTIVHLGGVLSGDRLQLHVELAAQASATLRTAAAAQIYRMPGQGASQTTSLRLASNSSLAWLPEPTILFGGARFSQITRIELAAGARLALLDVLVPGRLARGECYQFDTYTQRLEIRDAAGRLLVAEYARLEPQQSNFAAAGLLQATPVVGSLYLLGNYDRQAVHTLLQQHATPNTGSAMLPGECGQLIRVLGTTASMVHGSLITFWQRLNWLQHNALLPSG